MYKSLNRKESQMTEGKTNNITYIALGTNVDKVKAFILELNAKINEYNGMIKSYKKGIDNENKSNIYDYVKEQIKETKKEFRSIRIRCIVNEKFPNFCDIKEINNLVLDMLTIEKLIGELAEQKRERISNNNEEYKNYIEKEICYINNKCSDVFKLSEDNLTKEKELSQSTEESLIKKKELNQLYKLAYFYLYSISDKTNTKMKKLKKNMKENKNLKKDYLKTYEYLSIDFEDAEFWIAQMENWKETILKQAISDLN